MIIWNGLGFLVAVYVFGCSLVANLVVNSVTGSEQYWEQHRWPFGQSLLVAAVLSWFTGRFLASRGAQTLIEKETGKEIVVQPYHAFFFVKMHWWGPILAVIGIAVTAVDLLHHR